MVLEIVLHIPKICTACKQNCKFLGANWLATAYCLSWPCQQRLKCQVVYKAIGQVLDVSRGNMNRESKVDVQNIFFGKHFRKWIFLSKEGGNGDRYYFGSAKVVRDTSFCTTGVYCCSLIVQIFSSMVKFSANAQCVRHTAFLSQFLRNRRLWASPEWNARPLPHNGMLSTWHVSSFWSVPVIGQYDKQPVLHPDTPLIDKISILCFTLEQAIEHIFHGLMNNTQSMVLSLQYGHCPNKILQLYHVSCCSP